MECITKFNIDFDLDMSFFDTYGGYCSTDAYIKHSGMIIVDKDSKE